MYDTPKPTTPTKRVVSLATTTAITSTPPPAQHHHRLQELEEGGEHHLVTPLTWVRDTAHVFRDFAATTSPPHLTMTSDENPFVCDESMMMTSSPVTPEDGAEDVMSTVSSLSNGSLRIMSNVAPAGEEALEDGGMTTSPPPHEIRILRLAPKEEFEYQVPDWLRELATCSHESSLSSSAAPLPPPPCLSHVSPSLQQTTTTATAKTTTTLRPVLETTTNMLVSPLNNHSNRKLTLSYANGKLVAQRANNPTSMSNDMPQQQHQKQLNNRRQQQQQQQPSYGASPSCSPVGCTAANNNNYSAVAVTATPPGCCSEDPLLGNRPRRRQRREVSATFSVGSIVGQSSWVTPSASYGAYAPEGSTTTSSTTLDQMSAAPADEPISYTNNIPADYNAQSLEVQRQQMRAYHALNEYAAASAAAAAAAGGCDGGGSRRKKGRRNITNPVREDIKHVWGCVASPIIRRHNNNKHHHHHGGAGGGGCGVAGGDNRVNLKRASGCLT